MQLFNAMDFKDTIKLLSERVSKLKDSLQTEESVKNALIMPFIQTLGYDVFNPFEVMPEFTCDIGTKKGEDRLRHYERWESCDPDRV